MQRAGELLGQVARSPRSLVDASAPDLFGETYRPPPLEPEVVEPGRIQRDIEDEIQVGAEQVSKTGGDVEEYVSRMHSLKYGKRISGLLKAGRDHATKLAREGSSPEEAEAAGIELTQRHITNLENQIAAGEQSAEAEERGPAFQGLVEGFTTRKGLARHALNTGVPMAAALIASGPLGWGTIATIGVTAAVGTLSGAASQKFVDDQDVDWKRATTEGLTNILPVPVIGSAARGAIASIANPLVRRAVGTLAVASAEAIEEPVQAIATALVGGDPIPSTYALATEATAGGILGGGIGGAAGLVEQSRQEISDGTAGATEVEAAPPKRTVGRLAQEAADDQLTALEQALGAARFAGDLPAIQTIEAARQAILDARAKGSESPVSPDPPAPGEAGPITAPAPVPPPTPPAAPTAGPAAPSAPTPGVGGPPPGPVGGTSIRPQVPTETAAGAAGELTAAEEAGARQAGAAPQVRSLTEQGRAEGSGEPAPPTPPVVRGPTGGTARGVETTPAVPPPGAGVPTAGPAAPPATPGQPGAAPAPPAAPTPVPAPVPARRLKIGRGANGQVDVVFQDQNHADLFSAVGRSRRQNSGQGGRDPDWAGLAARFGIPPDLIGQAASRYREAVMAGVRGLPQGESFVAPTLADVMRPADAVARGAPADALAVDGVEEMAADELPTTAPPAPPAPSPAATGGRITLERTPDGWVAHHEGPIASEVEQLFGTTSIPTPFAAEANPEELIAQIQQLNPGVEVSVAPQSTVPAEVALFWAEEPGNRTSTQLQRRFGVGFNQAEQWREELSRLLPRTPTLATAPAKPAPPAGPRLAAEGGRAVVPGRLTRTPDGWVIEDAEGNRIADLPLPPTATLEEAKAYAKKLPGVARVLRPGKTKPPKPAGAAPVLPFRPPTPAEPEEGASTFIPPTRPKIEDMGPAQRKAMDAALARVPEAQRAEAQRHVEEQLWRRKLVEARQDDYDRFGREFDSTGQKIKNRPVKRRAAKEALSNAKALLEAGWTTVGSLAPDKNVVNRIRQVSEGKGYQTEASKAARAEERKLPLTGRAYEGVKGFVEVHPDAPSLEEAITKVQEYAAAHPRTDEDVLVDLERLAGQVEGMSSDALRLRIDIPGLGPSKVAAALAKRSGADFDKIVAYRREAEAQERAMEEFFAEFDDREFAHPGLRSLADALEEDQAAGLNDAEDADPPLLKTFMWGIVDPATGEQVEQEAALAAIRLGHGRLFSRIRTAYQDASTGFDDDIPFDIPEGGASDEEIMEAKRDFAFVSAPQDPFGGRYGPPPKKLTPEQLEAQRKWIAKRLGGPNVGLPAHRPAADLRRDEGEAAPAAVGDERRGEGAAVGEGAAGSGERGRGRGPGVPAGVPGAAGQPGATAAAPARVGPPAATREGIFQIVNPREGETLERAPKYELIPKRLLEHLSDEQKLGVAKAIEALDAGSGFLFQDGTGVGKAASVESPILTPSGWRRLGDLRVGDEVIAGDGSATMVTGVFPQGQREACRVEMSDGSATECCDEHLWLTRNAFERGHGTPAQVRPLFEIERTQRAHVGLQNERANHAIPMVGVVQFAARQVKLDGYLLGVLIGDGALGRSSVVLTSVDEFVVGATAARLPAGDRITRYSGGISYGIGGGATLVAMREYGLAGHRAWEKFVPECYLYNTPEIRLAMLRGLMDTDGTVNANGTHTSFCTTSEQLAKDVQFLVRSFGGVSKIKPLQKRYQYKGRVLRGRPAFGVTVTMPAEINPFLLPRKANRVRPKTKHAPARFIERVVRTGVMKEMLCISVAHRSRLYVTDDFIVTHNTREILATAHRYALQGLKVLIVAPSAAISPTKDAAGGESPSGSYADDSAAMGVPVKFTRGRAPLKAGTITLGTYHNLRDYKVDKDTVLVFDESHLLKNMGDSERAAGGTDLMRRAKVTLFASATPGDKAYHLGYLASIGILEGKPMDQAMRDLGLRATESERVSARLKAEHLAKLRAKHPNASEKWLDKEAELLATEKFLIWRITSLNKHRKALEALFNRLTRRGTVIKREVDLSPVQVSTVVVPLPPEGKAVMDRIEAAKFDRKLALMHMRRQQEPFKLAKVQELIRQELGLGRQVVVFATRVRESQVVKRTRQGDFLIAESEGTLKSIGEWLEAEGISHAEIHGEAKEESKIAQARFQSGNAKVLIATYEKGGTGINLDDRSGAAPRTMILMTAPFDSVSIVQAIGRVHRFTTRSASKIVMLYSDHDTDRWNAAVMGGKLRQLHAQVSGDIAALDLSNTSADEEALLAGGAHYMDVAAVLAGHGAPGQDTSIFGARHYGKIIHQLKQMGVKIKLTGGDFEIPTHEGFAINGTIGKTPDETAYARFRWDHDEEAGDLRVAEALKPRPVSRESAETVENALRELHQQQRGRKRIVSTKQYDYLHRTLTRLGASWGVRELPGSFQIQTRDGDFYTGELTPIREGARLVFGKATDDIDQGVFYWQRLAGEVKLEEDGAAEEVDAPVWTGRSKPTRREAKFEHLRRKRLSADGLTDSERALFDELRIELENEQGSMWARGQPTPLAERGITAALDRFAAEGGESTDPDFEMVGHITGVVGTPTAKIAIPAYARPELPWGSPIRIGQGQLLTPGAAVPGTPGASIAATTIREGFESIGRIDWDGIVVRSLADAGAVFHTARNPSLEHAVLFFVDRFGVIRGSMQATSNSPNFVSWGTSAEFYGNVDAKIAGLAAQGITITGVIDLHNHPSGSTTPSGADIRHFEGLGKHLGVKYLGSAIIDHERISIRTPAGKRYNVTKRAGGFADPDPFLAEGIDSGLFYHKDSPFKIRGFADLRPWAESLLDQGLWQSGSTDISVLFVDGDKRSRVVTIVPQSVFMNRRAWQEFTDAMARASGASYVMAATDGGFAGTAGLADTARAYIEEGLLQEMVDLRTQDTPRGLMEGAGFPLPTKYGWKDQYARVPRSVRLEHATASLEPPRSAYPAWDKKDPEWWSRRVDFARARTLARGRGGQANVGVDPQAFWDAFVLGVDAIRRGIRKFADWIAALARDIPGFRSWGKRVWDYTAAQGAPVVVEIRGQVRPFDQALGGVQAPETRNLQPIRSVPRTSVGDLVAATEALLAGGPVDVGAGKPTGIGKPDDLAVNINNVQDQNGIRDTTARIVRGLEARFALARQKYTVAELKDLAIALGYDEADYLRMLRVKGALTAPEIIAGRILRQHAGVDFGNRWAAWRDADARANEKGLEPGEQRKRSLDALEAEREKQASLQKFVGMMFGTAAAGAEAGRALYAHKLLVSTLTPEEQFMQRLLRAGRADVKQMEALADALAKGDNAAVARLIRKIHKPGFVRMLVEYFINSLLSGPPTFVANVTGNVAHEAVRTVERGFAARLEQLGVRQGVERLLTGQASPTDRVVGEAMAALRAQVRHKFGLLASLDMARQAIAKEDLRFLQAVKGESYVPAIPGLFGRIVRTPGRVMEALDIGSKINAMAAERAALLWRRAYLEVGKKGLDSPEFRDRLAELHALMDEWVALEEQRIADPFTFQRDHGAEGYMFLYRNRDLAAIYRDMKKAADVSTFRDETTRFTSFVKQVRGAYPWLTFVVPFVHTTERILVQGFRRTPLGLLKTAYNIQQGKLEGGEASDRLAQGIIGTMVTAAIYMLAADGLITGGGPEEPKERESWLKTGKLPYAIRIGDTWVSYARIEPFATIFGFAADLAEAKDEKTAGDAFGKLHFAMLNNVTNKTYLEGIVSAAEAVGNPDRYMARFWKRSVGALVPNLLATAARAIDPTIRETDDLSQVLISRVPVLSEELPPRITGTGEPRERSETALSRMVSPVRYSEEAGPEKNLERIFLETGYSPSQPPREITLPGTLGRKVALTRAERDIYGAYARRATDFARTLAKNGDWARVDAYAKEEILKRIYRFAHDAARRQMLASVLGRLKRGEAEVAARR